MSKPFVFEDFGGSEWRQLGIDISLMPNGKERDLMERMFHKVEALGHTNEVAVADIRDELTDNFKAMLHCIEQFKAEDLGYDLNAVTTELLELVESSQEVLE